MVAFLKVIEITNDGEYKALINVLNIRNISFIPDNSTAQITFIGEVPIKSDYGYVEPYMIVKCPDSNAFIEKLEKVILNIKP